jgi:hypothetical protein
MISRLFSPAAAAIRVNVFSSPSTRTGMFDNAKGMLAATGNFFIKFLLD